MKNLKLSKVAVITSGGDVPGLNACIRSIVKIALINNIEIIGIENGFDGLISGKFIPLYEKDVINILNAGGTILKSSRSKKFKTKAGRRQAYENIKKENIDAIVLIGGDGSLRGASIFTKEYKVNFICIPKTIDNDISHTDVCIGYDTALNTITEAIDRIRNTSQSHQRIYVIEVMGRDSGHLAFNAGIAGGANLISIPEIDISLKNLKNVINTHFKINDSALLFIVAEGKLKNGAKTVTNYLHKIIPKSDIGVCVLGHIQRGGIPSASDRILATKLGYEAIDAILKGKKNCMLGMQKNTICFTPINLIRRHHLNIDASTLHFIKAVIN